MTAVKKITNREIPAWVGMRAPFDANSTYARLEYNDYGRRYVVYSYHDGWPMFIYDDATQVWYENTEKISRTTSRNHSLAKRGVSGTVVPVNQEDAKYVARYGSAGLVIASNQQIGMEEFEDVPY